MKTTIISLIVGSLMVGGSFVSASHAASKGKCKAGTKWSKAKGACVAKTGAVKKSEKTAQNCLRFSDEGGVSSRAC